MNNIILKLVIGFILRQIAKFAESTDWTKIKADALARIADLIPGTFFDQAACDLVAGVIDACALALKDAADLKAFADALNAKDWAGALDALEDLLQKILPATDAACNTYMPVDVPSALAAVRAMKSAI